MPEDHGPFAPPTGAADQQKDHELGIRVVLDDLRRQGYQVESVNTDQAQHPQIVAMSNGGRIYVAVKTQRGPMPELAQTIREQLLAQAVPFSATCYFAPLALWATGEQDSSGNEGFFVKYHGIQRL